MAAGLQRGCRRAAKRSKTGSQNPGFVQGVDGAQIHHPIQGAAHGLIVRRHRGVEDVITGQGGQVRAGGDGDVGEGALVDVVGLERVVGKGSVLGIDAKGGPE